MRLKHAIDGLGLTLPQLNSITLTGPDGAQRVRGANPPRTRPTPIRTPEKPLWKAKRTAKTKPAEAEPTPGNPPGRDEKTDPTP